MRSSTESATCTELTGISSSVADVHPLLSTNLMFRLSELMENQSFPAVFQIPAGLDCSLPLTDSLRKDTNYRTFYRADCTGARIVRLFA